MECIDTQSRRLGSGCAPVALTVALTVALALALAAASIGPADALTKSSGAKISATDPSWRPEVSERLVKLPASYLKKSLDRDFAKSELGLAIEGLNDDIGFKSRTLGDLKAELRRARYWKRH